MTDQSVIFIKDRFVVDGSMSLKLSSLNISLLLAALLIATTGGILQIGGAELGHYITYPTAARDIFHSFSFGYSTQALG